MRCRFCQSEILRNLTLTQLLKFSPVYFNHCCASCYLEIVKVEFTQRGFCPYCRKKTKEDICQDCQLWQKEYQGFKLDHHYLYEHNEKMSDYFKTYKFLGDIRMADTFSADIQQELVNYAKQGFVIVPIPVSRKRLETRGFNQVEQFLKEANIPYQKILKKRRDTASQSEKTREERLKMEQPFYISKRDRRKVTNQSILVVDDVYTTGRTILYAYDQLNNYHPLEIKSFSITR